MAAAPTAYETGKVYAIPVQDSYVVEPPVWSDHWERAKNWLAILEETPHKPGGVRRTWCERGHGRFRYSMATVLEGDAIEFGGDRIWADGEGRSRERWYGEVVKVTDEVMHVRYFETIKEMFATINDRESRILEVTEV